MDDAEMDDGLGATDASDGVLSLVDEDDKRECRRRKRVRRKLLMPL
jgi:hypothetical protein